MLSENVPLPMKSRNRRSHATAYGSRFGFRSSAKK